MRWSMSETELTVHAVRFALVTASRLKQCLTKTVKPDVKLAILATATMYRCKMEELEAYHLQWHRYFTSDQMPNR